MSPCKYFLFIILSLFIPRVNRQLKNFHIFCINIAAFSQKNRRYRYRRGLKIVPFPYELPSQNLRLPPKQGIDAAHRCSATPFFLPLRVSGRFTCVGVLLDSGALFTVDNSSVFRLFQEAAPSSCTATLPKPLPHRSAQTNPHKAPTHPAIAIVLKSFNRFLLGVYRKLYFTNSSPSS